MEERDILYRLRNDDPAIIDLLVDEYKRPLFGFIMRMVGDEHEAEEVFQETWIRVIRKRRSFKGNSKFSTWLFQIALNLVRDRRRSGMNRTYVQVEDYEDILSCDPDVSPEKLLLARRVRDMVDELPDKMREVVVLKFFHDLSDAEIAEIAGCPVGTVKSRYYRAYEQLRDKWEKREQ